RLPGTLHIACESSDIPSLNHCIAERTFRKEAKRDVNLRYVDCKILFRPFLVSVGSTFEQSKDSCHAETALLLSTVCSCLGYLRLRVERKRRHRGEKLSMPVL